jgi:hypothetical protein
MLARSLRSVCWGMALLSGAGCIAACTDGFSSSDCRETRTCPKPLADGGESGAHTGDGGASDLSSGGADTAPGGGGVAEGGTVSAGGAGGIAGSAAEAEACPEGYQPWLSSSFSFPDGDVIGTADLPSMPWRPSGNLAIDTGRLTGEGTAVVSQARSFPYDGTRLRFRARFSDSSQKVTLAANAADDGTGGLRLTLAASGELVLSEGASVREQAAFDPLDTGVDWFVEAELKGATAHVTLASGSYGKASATIATIETDALAETAQGERTAVKLESHVGISPALDELSIARCGVPAPDYEARFVDTFERANSATIGKAELPATATWLDPSGTFKIVNGGLQSSGGLKTASVLLPEQLPLTGLRIRTSVKAVSGGDGPYLWADVNFNVANGIAGIADNGFWISGRATESTFYTGIFPGGGSLEHNAAETDVYFVQLDREGAAAVITVREQSFDGPILGTQFAGALEPTPSPGEYLTVHDEGGDGTRWEDIRVDVYPTD